MSSSASVPTVPNRLSGLGGGRATGIGATILGFVGAIAIWALLARTAFSSSGLVPAPWDVASRIVEDGWSFWSANIWATVRPALLGYAWGTGLGCALALLIVILPVIERGVLRIAVAVYCLPIIAIGPILVIVMEGTGPGVVLAALSCFFPTLIGVTLGLHAAERTSLDMVSAYGGDRRVQLLRVRFPAALPSLFAALRLAAPLALLGAMVAEYMGASSGLGVSMLAAQRTFQIEQVWAIAVVSGLVAGAGYLIVLLIGRLVIRWPAQAVTMSSGTQRWIRPGTQRSPYTQAVVAVIGLLVSFGVLIGLWALAIQVFGLDPFVAKGPADVWEYVFKAPEASANRQLLLDALSVTLGHAALGFFVGLIVGVVTASAFSVWRVVERVGMPLAIALQAFPVVAMVPLIALVIGRNNAAVAVVCALVTFFATLIYVLVAMQSTPRAVLDLVRAYGGNRWTALWRAMLPASLPAIFASARLAAPGALFGALLAEWLVTGDGLGYLMLQAGATSSYEVVWAATVLITIVSIALYALIAAAERRVTARITGTETASA